MDIIDGTRASQAAIPALIVALIIVVPGLFLRYFLREARMDKNILAWLERAFVVGFLVAVTITFFLNY